jgi:hypothetical protein
MKRAVVALGFGALLTLLPWVLRPVFGDHVAILWLPGFAAVAHWFPLGLHASNANIVKLAGCSVNVLTWAAVFWLVSYSSKVRVWRA